MKKNAKKNNKGFSLVELIIVVAIMAILIGVLGGQYLKFVERSRQSADKANVDELIRAVQIYAADPEADTPFTLGKSATVTLNKDDSMAVDGDNKSSVTAALTAAGITDVQLKSDKWDGVVLTITIDGDGNVSVTATTGKEDILGDTDPATT
mgnify:CR=1 FL=1